MDDRVLVFDVNETLIDIESLTPTFERIFGDPAIMRTWFGELVTYSMTVTLAGYYTDFIALGRAALRMVGDIRGVDVTQDDEEALATAMRTMPAHPDVEPGLQALRDQGYRLVTLTNSPSQPNSPSALDSAGLSGYVEQQFSVHTERVFKPASALYANVAARLGVPVSACTLVAAHCWDTIGGQGAGMRGALITRPGNAALVTPGVPQPDVIARDLLDLAAQLQNR
ncbi:haloacid dehalogenase [Mycolicibacterium madagascariense]|uniref:Haloacid dehalogenase n=1 Tax=Mycolicibacterium madagascariense TaxID=212765 RepID=A0A7I7XCR9_9MYCO|nr:haloacid dehalogenase type II [Mycolicibacterium madagascariense]MCV7011298.1 haloacid dehalogenase type II [Mycolicibacterium madagascariense]BBZ26677.1 haloacid dehalogenase [Mycolicibacterium madagascariense]